MHCLTGLNNCELTNKFYLVFVIYLIKIEGIASNYKVKLMVLYIVIANICL